MISRELRNARKLLDHTQVSRRELVRLSALTGAALTAGTPRFALAQDGSAVQVTYWHHFTSETEMTGMERVLESFADTHPNIEVLPENIPNADYMAKFTSAAVSNSLPDTAMVTVDRLPDMLAMEALTPLNERLDGWELRDAFPDSVWKGATIEGKTYGIPAFMFVNWMYYRQDWFEEAGIDGPPTTWEEFEEAAIAITDPEQGRYGFGLRGGDGGESILIPVIQSFGTQIVDDQGCAALDVEATTEALRFYTGLFTEHQAAPPSAPGDSYAQIMEAFKTGQTGMVLHHTGSLTEIVEALGDKVMTAPVPAGPAGQVAMVSPLYNGMPSTENPDAAWAWITQWADVDAEIAFLEETGYFPPNTLAAEDERLTSNPLYAAAIETMDTGQLPPQFPGYSGWSKQTVLPLFQQVLVGELTPEEAAERMAEGLAEATGC